MIYKENVLAERCGATPAFLLMGVTPFWPTTVHIFSAGYPKFWTWQTLSPISCYLEQSPVHSLHHPNLPCIQSDKIFFPYIYSIASSQNLKINDNVNNLFLASTCTPSVPIFVVLLPCPRSIVATKSLFRTVTSCYSKPCFP